MGLHPKYMPCLEEGTANPTVATLIAASVAYKVPLRDLFLERCQTIRRSGEMTWVRMPSRAREREMRVAVTGSHA
jgi:transcriptional regulator with XRE-family HTH domain